MQGYKTMIVAAVSLFGGLATIMGVGIPADTLAALTDSVTTLVGGAMVLSGIVTGILRLMTTTPVGAKTAPLENTATNTVTKEGGFARIGMLFFLIALAGCAGSMVKPIEPIAVPQSLPDAGKEAQQFINEANVSLRAVYRVIGQNAEAGVWTKVQAQGYQDEAKKYSGMVDKAQDALDLRLFDDARAQASVASNLLMILSKKVAAQARKAEQK